MKGLEEKLRGMARAELMAAPKELAVELFLSMIDGNIETAMEAIPERARSNLMCVAMCGMVCTARIAAKHELREEIEKNPLAAFGLDSEPDDEEES